MLERKLGSLQTDKESKTSQLQELCADIDPLMFGQVTAKMDSEIDKRNALIKDMEYHLAYVHKSYNDTVRTFSSKLVEFGIPEEDAKVAKLLQTNTSTVPAGLVADQ